MKTSKYLEELKTQSVADLNAQLVDAKKELFNLRFQNATNQLDNTSRIKEVRKNQPFPITFPFFITGSAIKTARYKNRQTKQSNIHISKHIFLI